MLGSAADPDPHQTERIRIKGIGIQIPIKVISWIRIASIRRIECIEYEPS